ALTFFFHAEDGIRDFHVTGVQTCALPISPVTFDDEGFMTDHTQWTPAIAADLAARVGIAELTDRHFLVIDFMRKEFAEKGTGPKIGRASCRERVERAGAAPGCKQKTETRW